MIGTLSYHTMTTAKRGFHFPPSFPSLEEARGVAYRGMTLVFFYGNHWKQLA